MLTTLYGFALNRPSVLRFGASVLWRTGCLGLLAGVVAAAITAILGIATSMAGGVPASYQQVVPGLPTWWIPESPLGIGIYLTLMLAAYLVNDLARELDRSLKH
jgi:hypothetical protein